MDIDFSKLKPNKREDARKILDQLNDISAAQAADTHTHPRLCQLV